MAILLIQIVFTTLVLLRYVWACVGVYISVWVCVVCCVVCVWVCAWGCVGVAISSRQLDFSFKCG